MNEIAPASPRGSRAAAVPVPPRRFPRGLCEWEQKGIPTRQHDAAAMLHACGLEIALLRKATQKLRPHVHVWMVPVADRIRQSSQGYGQDARRKNQNSGRGQHSLTL